MRDMWKAKENKRKQDLEIVESPLAERARGTWDGRWTGPVITGLQRALGEHRMSKRKVDEGEAKEERSCSDGMNREKGKQR